MSQKTEFCRVLPSCLGLLPKKAYEYLDSAVKESPTSDLTVEDAIAISKEGSGDIFLILRGGILCGSAFFMYGKGSSGKIMSVTLMGGDDFADWKKDFHDFMMEIATQRECKEIWSITREGWGKIFPDFKKIGVVYSLRLGG